LAPDLNEVTKSRCCDQRNPSAGTLDQRIRRYRGPVREMADILGANVMLLLCGRQPIKDSARQVFGSRWHLMDHDFIGRSIEQAEVSECPTDINAHNPAHLLFLLSSFCFEAARTRI
jgi:hypothetical protein